VVLVLVLDFVIDHSRNLTSHVVKVKVQVIFGSKELDGLFASSNVHLDQGIMDVVKGLQTVRRGGSSLTISYLKLVSLQLHLEVRVTFTAHHTAVNNFTISRSIGVLKVDVF